MFDTASASRVGAEPLDAPLDFAVGDARGERPADARHLAHRPRRRLRHRTGSHVTVNTSRRYAREAVHLVRGLADLRLRQDWSTAYTPASRFATSGD
jgi:hypothetical protein